MHPTATGIKEEVTMQIHRAIARSFHFALIFSFVVGLFAVLQAAPAQAQTRVNDRDMEALMRNLRDDAKSFRPQFDRAVHRSTIRKTSQERDARDLAAAFARQTETLLNRFKRDRKAETEFNTVLASAEQLDTTVNSLALGPEVISQWKKIRTELHQIADAYGVPERFHRDRDAMGTDSDQSCLQSAGDDKANRLVNQCMQVSPATHPPCNAQTVVH
jgi:hypothetical protein